MNLLYKTTALRTRLLLMISYSFQKGVNPSPFLAVSQIKSCPDSDGWKVVKCFQIRFELLDFPHGLHQEHCSRGSIAWSSRCVSIPTHTTSCVSRYQVFTLGKVLTVWWGSPIPLHACSKRGGIYKETAPTSAFLKQRGEAQMDLIWWPRLLPSNTPTLQAQNLKCWEEYWVTVPQSRLGSGMIILESHKMPS